MDFFAHQEAARKKTTLLLSYMTLAVGGIVFSIYSIIWFVFGYEESELSRKPFLIPELLGPVTLGVLTLVTTGALYKLLMLRDGGNSIAKSLGGQQIFPNTQDPDERKVFNIVQEMAIASGLPPPPVYILPEETSINAFAAGYRPEAAVVAVTHGSIRALSRDELQGVIAHEFSHILNGDMRLNIRLIGLLHGILLIALLGRQMMRPGTNSDKDRAPVFLMGMCLLCIGQIGVLFGHLIKSAVSRQREFLADASAVQFTRLPDGLAGALKKIGGLEQGSRIHHPRAEEASHMYFSNGLRSRAFSPMATHPPLKRRVARLDPNFNGTFPRLNPVTLFAPQKKQAPSSTRMDEKDLFKHLPGQFQPLPAGGAVIPVLTEATLDRKSMDEGLASVGNPTQAHLDRARQLLSTLPAELREAAASSDGSRALIFAQLLRRNTASRDSMLTVLKKQLPPERLSLIPGLEQALSLLSPGLFLPLAELCLPGLRMLEAAEYRRFKRQIQILVEMDQTITLFEFALGNMLFRSLDVYFDGEDRKPFKYYALQGLASETSVLLTAMVRLSQPDEHSAQRAFALARETGPKGSEALTFLPPAESTLKKVQESLDAMNTLAYPVRRQVLELCLNGLLQDGKIGLEEAELFRAIAAAFGCPVPVWIIGEHIPD